MHAAWYHHYPSPITLPTRKGGSTLSKLPPPGGPLRGLPVLQKREKGNGGPYFSFLFWFTAFHLVFTVTFD